MPSPTSQHGMVVTPHPMATMAGVEALRAGGTAVDAAIAANAMLAVVYCNACGLGGDAFALVWDPADERLHGFNGSGRSPAALTIEAVRAAGHDTMPQRGPLTIDVPGAVDAWVQLLDRFGRRSLADALLPAARAADDGYELTAITARAVATAPADVRRSSARRLRDGRRTGHDLPPATPRGDVARDRRWRPRRLLRRADRRGDRPRDPGGRRRHDRRRHRRAPWRLGRADLDGVPRRRGRHDPAELAGHHGAHRAQRPVDPRLADGLADRTPSRSDRGDQGGLERARPMRRGPRSRPGGSRAAAVAGARAVAGVADVARRGASVHADEPARGRHGLPLRRRCRRDDGQPDRVELHGLRLGRHGRFDGDHAPEPRRLLLARSLASQCARAAVAHRSTP